MRLMKKSTTIVVWRMNGIMSISLLKHSMNESYSDVNKQIKQRKDYRERKGRTRTPSYSYKA